MSRLLGTAFKAACLVAAAAALGACQKNHSAYALTATGSLLQFNTSKPGTIVAEATITGLAAGESLVQIDYRPADHLLYGLTSDNKLATVDPNTGAVNVYSGQFTNLVLSNPVMSWDPVNDNARIITAQYNMRVAQDGTLTFSGSPIGFDSHDTNNHKNPQLVAIAYSNHVASAGNTTLYGLDLTTQSLVYVGDKNVGPPGAADSGILHTVGKLSSAFTFNANAGFNIEVANGTGFAVLQQSGTGATLYTIDLPSGGAASVGAIGDSNRSIISLAIVPD